MPATVTVYLSLSKMKYFGLLLLCVNALAIEDNTLGMSEDNPANSCNEIFQRNPTSRGTVDQYWIKTNEGLFKVTCNMKLKCGGVEGGWMQVVDVDMNRDDSCPGTWRKISNPKILCLGLSTAGCASAYFNVKGVSYVMTISVDKLKLIKKDLQMPLQAKYNPLMVLMLMVFPLL